MTFFKTLPNTVERELAANFYFEVLPSTVVNWVATGLEIQEHRIDEDVVALADMLAGYRCRLQRTDTRMNNRYQGGQR